MTITPRELACGLRARKVKRLEQEQIKSPYKIGYDKFDDLPLTSQYEYEAVARDAMELLGFKTGEEEEPFLKQAAEPVVRKEDVWYTSINKFDFPPMGAEDMPALRQTGEDTPALRQTGEDMPALRQTGEEPADYSAIEAHLAEVMTTVPDLTPLAKGTWIHKQLAEGLPTRVEETPTPTPVKLQSVLEQLANSRRNIMAQPGPDPRPRRWLSWLDFMAGVDIRCGDMLAVDERGMVVPYKVKDEDDEPQV